MDKLIEKTDGLKTYLVVLAMLVYVGLGYFLEGTLNTELLLEALALAGLRHGISKL